MLGAALAGCASGPESLPEGLSVSLVQLRGDIAPGRVQVHVENGSDREVTIAAASFSSAALDGDGVWQTDREASLAPGRAVNLPVVLPPQRCTDDAPDATVRIELDSGSGMRRLTATADDELDVLARLAATECDREAVEAVASVEVGVVAPTADGIALDLAVTPVGSGDSSVRLVELRGTPLLRFAAGEQWPLDLEVTASGAPTTVPVIVEPRRCDAHAIAEDKVGTRLTLVAEANGAEASYPLPLSDGLAAELLSLTAAACGLSD